MSGLTPSEIFVNDLAHRAFLTLWTHPNPVGKKGKELCDCLVVCDDYVVIISVKEIGYKDTGDTVGFERWKKDAVDTSSAQIWGAERWLNSVDEFKRSDGRVVQLPPRRNRKFLRIAVALGANRNVSTVSGDFGHGLVFLCDEYSLGVIFGLLDTIVDFIHFFLEVEALIDRDAKLIFDGGGFEDLVAVYLQNNGTFPFGNADLVIVVDTIFRGFKDSGEFTALQSSYADSYFWDRLIDHFVGDLLTDGMFDFHTREVTDNQLALVQMVLQPRYVRSHLASALKEFLLDGEKIGARVAGGYGGTAFVFQAGSSSDRESRTKELAMRSLVVRAKMPGITTVVGIATDRPGTSSVGYSSDISFIRYDEWNDELEEAATKIQRELGYFKDVAWTQNGDAHA